MMRSLPIIFLIALSVPCLAAGDVFLYPRVDRAPGAIIFSDIAKIDADAGTAIRMGNIVIDDGRVSDGYLDRKEVMDILRESGIGDVNVYGSGVRIVRAEAGAPGAPSPVVVVKKGKPVRFQVISARMRVEVAGTAMNDGAVGDVIPVKLKGAAVSRGRILNERVVELAL